MTPSEEEITKEVSKLIINRLETTQNVSDNKHAQLMLEIAPTKPAQVITLGHKHKILGLPILHLTLIQKDPPWIQLIKMGINPIAAKLCKSQAESCYSC